MAAAQNTDDDGEMLFSGTGSSEENAFDEIVGAIETLLLDPSFIELQTNFLQKHCQHFEDTDENKLIYTEIFTAYTTTIESFIEKCISEDIEGFSMDAFGAMLQSRGQDEICGDVFDMLLSLGDFNEFKALMVEHRKQNEDSSSSLSGILTAQNDWDADGLSSAASNRSIAMASVSSSLSAVALESPATPESKTAFRERREAK